MSERSSRQLRGAYALFLAGQQSDEPIMVAMDDRPLRNAGGRQWGHDNVLVMLWATPSDRKFALDKLAKSRSAFPVRG